MSGMDLKFKPPSLESFFSPNHQPHSLSTIWADKNKVEEVDPSISDMEEQGSYQGKEEAENSKQNESSENLNEAFEWENGVGTLPGSDLKFRVNEHGDIEVITESLELDELGDSNILDVNISARVLENGDISPDQTQISESDIENGIFEKHQENAQGNSDMQFELDEESDKDASKEQDESAKVSESEHELESLPPNNEDKGMEDLENEQNPSPKKDSGDDAILRSESSLEDNLPDFDPVLNEDIASMLYDDVSAKQGKVQDCTTPTHSTEINKKDEFSPEHSDLQIVSVRSDHVELPNKCIICGKPSQLAKRFCSRQCIGRHAAIRRKENQLSDHKKGKHARKKLSTRSKSHDRGRRSPHSNDILTVVQDESSGRRNNLKIKIRWSSASNDNQDEDYPESRELPKRRVGSNGSYDGTRGENQSKDFVWSSYLQEVEAIAATTDIFQDLTNRDPFLTRNPFRIGMALEGVDPEHELLICPLFVAEIRGCRIRLSFCGYSESHDFWRNCDSPLIFPCGFCKETNRTLQSPKGYQMENFTWEEYARSHRITPAPADCFTKLTEQSVTPNCPVTFEVGQKFEAVDKHNPDLTCVATVQDIVNGQILVHFDGWSHNFDYWCPLTSQYIHPAGWCEQHNKVLSLPEGYNMQQKFNWDSYLLQAQSGTVDAKSFTEKSGHSFKTGMKLEMVDPRNKRLIRVATIAEINSFQVKIHFDGWSDMYDFMTNLENTDLHPVDWCEMSGHPLEAPVSFNEMEDATWQTGGCPIPGCTGAGHIRGAKFMTHYSEFGCPYSPQNLTKETIKDRLTAYKPRRSAQLMRDESFVDCYDDPGFAEMEVETRPRSAKVLTRKRNIAPDQSSVMSPYKKMPRENTESDFKCERGNTAQVVSKWTIEDVARFIRELTREQMYEHIFSREEIDGRAMLMLTQSDILRILKIKLGPAVKIYNAIMTIKEAA